MLGASRVRDEFHERQTEYSYRVLRSKVNGVPEIQRCTLHEA